MVTRIQWERHAVDHFQGGQGYSVFRYGRLETAATIAKPAFAG
jgi:hypothetical protein